MIVIGDDNFAADQDVIPNLNQMSSGYMHELTDTYVLSDHDFWQKNLVVVAGNRFQPESRFSGKVFPDINGRQASQVSLGADLDFSDIKFSADQSASNGSSGIVYGIHRKNVKSVFTEESQVSIQNSPCHRSRGNFLKGGYISCNF